MYADLLDVLTKEELYTLRHGMVNRASQLERMQALAQRENDIEQFKRVLAEWALVQNAIFAIDDTIRRIIWA